MDEVSKRKVVDEDHANCHLDDDVNCVRLQRKLIEPHSQVEDEIDDKREGVLLQKLTTVVILGPPMPPRRWGSCYCIPEDKKVSPCVDVEAVEDTVSVDDSEDRSRGWYNAYHHRASRQRLV